MKILLAAHKNPYGKNPRGGENSVRIICDYLIEKGHKLDIWCHGDGVNLLQHKAFLAEYILTWGKAAPFVAKNTNRPYMLMVRFWRNVQPLPVGDLMNDNLNTNFIAGNHKLFTRAHTIISNNQYSCDVIKRCHQVQAVPVYVPILGETVEREEDGGQLRLTMVTPEIYGEYDLMQKIRELRPEWNWLIVNSGDPRFHGTHDESIVVLPYMPSDNIWSRTKVLLSPVYNSDICGTRRTPIEAMRHGIPVISQDRCGIGEKIPCLLPRNATARDWIGEIDWVLNNYEEKSAQAHKTFNQYDTNGELAKIERAISAN